MNKYDILITKLNEKLKEIEEKETELDKKVLVNQDFLRELIKEQEKLTLEINRLTKIKEILIANDPKKNFSKFIKTLPVFLIVLGLINLFIISFIKVSSPFLLILLNAIMVFFSLLEEYLPNTSTIKILKNNNLFKTEDSLKKLTKELKKLNEKIKLKEKEINEYTKENEQALIKEQELIEEINLITHKKDIIINSIIATEELKINNFYEQDATLKLIKVK